MSEPANPSARAKAAKLVEQADRRRRVAQLALQRVPIAEIMARVGASKATVNRDLVRIRQEWRDEQRVAISAAQEHELAALARDEMRVRALLAQLPPDPAPKEGQPAADVFPMRVHLIRAKYLDTVLKIQAFRAKILGTEAPTRVEQKVDQTVHERRIALDALSPKAQALAVELAAEMYAPEPAKAEPAAAPVAPAVPEVPAPPPTEPEPGANLLGDVT